MNSTVAILLLVGCLVGIPWVISILTEGGAQAVTDAVDGSRTRKSEGYRDLLCSLSPSRVVGDLGTALTNRGWTCQGAGTTVTGTAQDGRRVTVEVFAKGSSARLRVSADPAQIERTAGEILAVLRESDPAARVKAVRS